MQTGDRHNLDGWAPDEAWSPWRPSAEEPWNLQWASHLLRRAAFGFPALKEGEDPWAGLQRVVQQGLEATLAELFQPPAADFADLMDTTGEQISQDNSEESLRGWWLYRMLYTPQPLVERMTLFWHSHFATSVTKVRRFPWMFAQNRTLRQNALGKLGPMVMAMSRDPAMIVWLDSHRNIKGHANENYGRELMELFTLGVGAYTEKDVQEAARAFTGWHTIDGLFSFNPRLHDDGPKTLLGQSGTFDGGDVVKILLSQPATAKFIVRKLFRQLVSESQAPSDALIEPLAAEFRQSDYDIALLTRRILSSRLFFSEAAYRQRIKSPVEYAVGSLRGLGATMPLGQLATVMNGMGQDLFAPPNVKGWDGGRAWLNTATLIARHNLMWELVGVAPVISAPPTPATPPEPSTTPAAETAPVAAATPDATPVSPPAPPADAAATPDTAPPATPTAVVAVGPATPNVTPPAPAATTPAKPLGAVFGNYCQPGELVKKYAQPGAAAQVNFLVDLFLQTPPPEESKKQLVEFLSAGDPQGPAWDQRLRQTLHMLLVLPDFHLS